MNFPKQVVVSVCSNGHVVLSDGWCMGCRETPTETILVAYSSPIEVTKENCDSMAEAQINMDALTAILAVSKLK